MHSGTYPLHLVRLGYDVLGTRVYNEYHVGERVPGTVRAHSIDLLGAFENWWTGGYNPLHNPSQLVGFDAVLAIGILTVASELLEVPVLAYLLDFGLAGLSDSESTPPNVSYAVEWTTGYGGRTGHGRTFLVGIPRGALELGREYDLTLDYLHRVGHAYRDLIDMVWNLGPHPGDLTLALAHRHPLPFPQDVSVWWTQIRGVRLPKRRIASRKSRLPRESATGIGVP